MTTPSPQAAAARWRSPSFSRLILPLLAVAGLIFAAVYILRGQPERTISPATREPAKATGALATAARVAGSGVVEPSSEVIAIGTAVSGLVTRLLVQPGDRVGQGQPLFVVDQRGLDARARETAAAIGEARAAIAEAEAAIAESGAIQATAQRQLALYRNAGDPAAFSRAELIRAEGEVAAARERGDTARARRDAARARLASAEAQSASVGTERGRATVRAPVAGQILSVSIRPGEFVSASAPQGSGAVPYIEMGQTDPLHARVDIDESEAVRVALGADAIISPRGAADVRRNASFVRVEPQIVPKRSLTNQAAERVDVRVMQVIYRLPASDDFRVGQQIDAFIPAKSAVPAPAPAPAPAPTTGAR